MEDDSHVPGHPTSTTCFQRDLSRALERGNQSYETVYLLSHGAREELQWWITYLEQWNGKSLLVHLAIKMFMKNRTDTTILILIDNTTAVAL